MGRILRTAENTRRRGPLNHRGQPDTGADPDPVILAGGSLELIWSRNTSDVAVIIDVGHGKDVHGHSDDGNQGRVQRGIEKGDETARENELHSGGVEDLSGSRDTHDLHYPIQHEDRPARDGDEREGAQHQ